MKLTQQQIDDFNREGWLFLPELFSPEEVAYLAREAVNIYDAESGLPLASCKGHAAGIYAVAFSPDSTRVATGGFDGQVRLYSATACTLEKSFVPVPLVGGVQ